MFRFVFIFFTAVVGGGLPSPAFAGKKTLRFSTSSTWAMPYGKIEDGALVDGFMLEFSRAISKELGVQPEFVILPRNRTEIAAERGEYDLRCHLSKTWVPAPDRFIWSIPLFRFSTIIVGHKSSQQIHSISDLYGKTIGTVLGYSYPDLNKALAEGLIRRDDTENQLAVYRKLAAGRNGYAITDKPSYDYFLKTSGARNKLASWEFAVSREESLCAILKSSRVSPNKVQEAIKRLKQNGTFDRILKKYY